VGRLDVSWWALSVAATVAASCATQATGSAAAGERSTFCRLRRCIAATWRLGRRLPVLYGRFDIANYSNWAVDWRVVVLLLWRRERAAFVGIALLRLAGPGVYSSAGGSSMTSTRGFAFSGKHLLRCCPHRYLYAAREE